MAEVKVIIAGSRGVTQDRHIDEAMAEFIEKYCPRVPHPKQGESTGGATIFIPGRPSEIVSGGCRGADEMGETWAKLRNIPVKVFEAKWKLHGKKAGPIRNQAMGLYAEAAVVIWDGVSRGSQSMIGIMQALNKPVLVWRV